MKNFKVTDKDTGKEYWVSRSSAVTGFIVAVDEEGDLYVLLEKRGNGCPDNVGKLCGVCGYIDYDETILDALVRETYEETGFDIKTEPCRLISLGVEDSNFTGNQNITHRFMIQTDLERLNELMKNGTINTRSEERGGEKDEVSELKLMSYLLDIEDTDSNNFAFGHKELIDYIAEEYT